MAKRLSSVVTTIVALTLCHASSAFSQEAFYKDKVIRIIVATAAGGGYDLYTRTMARHLRKYIPGEPTIAVENMPGAGHLIGANYVYRVAKPDGLTMGHFIGTLFLQQLLGKPGVEFDAVKFNFIGVPAQDNYMIGLSKTTGITSMEQWLASKRIVKIGGIGAGSATDDIPKVLAATIGLPLQVVAGYKGTSEVRLAFNSGEIEGICNAWESFKSTWRKELEANEVALVLQAIPTRHREVPNVPLAIDYAKTDEAKRMIRSVIHTIAPTVRPYVLPPGTPKDRVETLRRAFVSTMKDPDFLAEAAKAKLDINPLDGATLETNVKEVFNLDAALIPQLKEILK
ncbi:MAG: tripartite tricarboxylate transporter substrate-binding protein [Candidatus Binatia bacterium]